MLDIPSLAVILAALSSACLLWWFILFGRPLVARQKLEIETRKVRDRLVDAQMRGAIESNNPHLPLLLNYCGLVTDHADRLSLCRVVIVRRTMDRARFTPPTLKRAPRGILRNTELELDSLVWKYMIDGSRLWWLFYPTRPLYRRLPPLAEAAKS